MSKQSCVRLPTSDLAVAARAVLCEPDPQSKVARTHAAAEDWYAGRSALPQMATTTITNTMPVRPARPALPQLMAPRLMPRRRVGGVRGRIALLHAVAHIELNAIDLAWDLIGRFTAFDWPTEFFNDWVGVAADEARHFSMLSTRLNELGASYGDLPAHDGLWEAAMETSHDPLARLAVVPMVLEARGLDVTPAMIARLHRVDDDASAALLEIILREEIAHVAAGQRWFGYLCRIRGLSEHETWRKLVAAHYRGVPRPPFNEAARRAAGMAPELYRQPA
ncbi:MAG: ferritin-like domain-containing protein [Proteobacteria bacterium]|nr:ferritin-like domain-containing protein [Pseudomonadota bacterium]MDA1354967.1 ferritin-like domain-containing protein [Pseudomonadota bacterium]